MDQPKECWYCGQRYCGQRYSHIIFATHPLCEICRTGFVSEQIGYIPVDTPIWPVNSAFSTHRWYPGTKTPLTSRVGVETDTQITILYNGDVFQKNFAKFVQANVLGSNRFAMYRFPEHIKVSGRDEIVGFIFDTRRIITTVQSF